ncbi:MAG: hypothetical protein ACYTFQ_18670 [Planctomycetota bacterium]|jgi:hypothetical protein
MNFGRKAKRVARRAFWRGQITREEYEHVKEAVQDPELVRWWQADVERNLQAPWRDGEFDFAAIWEWFKENWPTILKILLTIAPLLLEPAPDEETVEEARDAARRGEGRTIDEILEEE